MLNCEIFIQLWQSYALLNAATQWISKFHQNLNFLIYLLTLHPFWVKVNAAYYVGVGSMA